MVREFSNVISGDIIRKEYITVDSIQILAFVFQELFSPLMKQRYIQLAPTIHPEVRLHVL